MAPNLTEDYLIEEIRKEILAKIRLILEQKHLYQNVQLNLDPIYETIQKAKADPLLPSIDFPSHVSSRPPSQKEADASLQMNLRNSVNTLLRRFWEFETESTPLPPAAHRRETNPFRFCLPTIKIACMLCDGVLPPHNSGYKNQAINLPELNFVKTIEMSTFPVQILFFPYQCQNCKGAPIVFVIRREGIKLQIVGRSHFEEVNAPKTIPSEEVRYFKDAVIAFNCGKTLAALFYLRVFIEHYFRRVLHEKGRLTGEDLGKRYAILLPDDFPRTFKALGTVYEEISLKLHAADEDDDQFKTSLADINRHFDLLKHFKLKNVEEASEALQATSESVPSTAPKTPKGLA
jgi:hypothetical protein